MRLVSAIGATSSAARVVERAVDGVVTTTGRYLQLQNARLTWPQSDRLPLHLGAIRPPTVALTDELADGIVLPALAEVRRVREIYDAARGGRKGRITVYLVTIAAALRGRSSGIRSRSADVGVGGGAEEIRAAVQRWTAAGADAVILQPGFDVDPGEFAAYIGEQVKRQLLMSADAAAVLAGVHRRVIVGNLR